MGVIKEVLQLEDRFSGTFNKFNSAASTATSIALRLGSAIGGIALAKTFVDTADAMSQITAKFNMITSSAEEAAALQNDIFQAAQRSRGSYEDMANTVTKLRQNAGAVFSNNNEALQFAENLNKTFKLAGTTQAEMASASLQLTQALGSGALRGQEFAAVMSSAPAVIQRIAEEMDVPIGQMKDLAAEGKITADIVKSALLNATDDINAQFETLPMTLADIFQSSKNTIEMALSDAFADWTTYLNSDEAKAVIQDVTAALVTFAQIGSRLLMGVAKAVTWLHQNWQRFTPLLYVAAGAAIAFGVAAVASGVAAAAAWLAMNWPILLIIALLAAVVIAAQKMGVTFEDVGRAVGAVFGWLYSVGYNLVADIWNVIASFAEFFANVFNDPVGAILHLFVDVFDTILSIIETVAAAVDAILGTDWSSGIANVRSAAQAWADEQVGPKQIQVERMTKLNGAQSAEYISKFSEVGANLGAKLDNFDFNLDSIAGFTETSASAISGTGEVNTVTEVGSIKNDVSLSDEDLKLYRDIAEARYMQNVEVSTLSPVVNVNVENAQDLNADDIGDVITNVLIEQVNSHTAVAHG